MSSSKEIAAIQYTRMLTENPRVLTECHIETLRDTGWPDNQTLEINQVVAYFNHINRTVLGLGGSTDDDTPGLSPNITDDPEDWSHRPFKIKLL